MKKSILTFLALAAAALNAHATLELANPSVTAAVGGFSWDYSASVGASDTVTAGTFFTIYDFGGFTGNFQPAGWTFSTALTTVPPTGISITDDPTLANLTWTYNGATPINGAAVLGDFGAIAGSNQSRDGEYASSVQNSTLPSQNRNVSNIPVPVPEMETLFPILSVCGAGIAASIPSFLRRRKKG